MRAKRLEMASDQVDMGLEWDAWTSESACRHRKMVDHVSSDAASVGYFRSLLTP